MLIFRFTSFRIFRSILKLTFSLFVLLVSIQTQGQYLQQFWQQSSYRDAFTLEIDELENYHYTGGSSYQGDTAVVIKADDYGTILWSSYIAGCSKVDDILSTKSGDLYVSAEGTKDKILKLDAIDGSIIWEKELNLINHAPTYFYSTFTQVKMKLWGETGLSCLARVSDTTLRYYSINPTTGDLFDSISDIGTNLLWRVYLNRSGDTLWGITDTNWLNYCFTTNGVKAVYLGAKDTRMISHLIDSNYLYLSTVNNKLNYYILDNSTNDTNQFWSINSIRDSIINFTIKSLVQIENYGFIIGMSVNTDNSPYAQYYHVQYGLDGTMLWDTIFPYTDYYLGSLKSRNGKMYSYGNANNIPGYYRFNTAYLMQDPTGIVGYNSESFEMNLYPNPVKDELTIDINESVSQIWVYDLQGSVVWQGQQQVSKISTQNFDSGVYFISVINTKDQIFTEKFVVE